jgi:hypothetical protein
MLCLRSEMKKLCTVSSDNVNHNYLSYLERELTFLDTYAIIRGLPYMHVLLLSTSQQSYVRSQPYQDLSQLSWKSNLLKL